MAQQVMLIIHDQMELPGSLSQSNCTSLYRADNGNPTSGIIKHSTRPSWVNVGTITGGPSSNSGNLVQSIWIVHIEPGNNNMEHFPFINQRRAQSLAELLFRRCRWKFKW